MDITRILPADAKSLPMDALVNIYTEALPLSERKTRATLEKMLSNPDYYFYLASFNNEIIGFAIVYAPARFSDYCLLEYIAVDVRCRSHGYGGQLLDVVAEIFSDRTMVLEVDSPYQKSGDGDLRKKRIAFYYRHGSKCVEGLRYILPMNVAGKPPEMVLLLHSSVWVSFVPKIKVQDWLTDIYTMVYGCKAEDPRISLMISALPDQIKLLDSCD